MNDKTQQKIHEAITHSNYVENEYSVLALRDSLDAWLYLRQDEWLDLNRILTAHSRLMCNLNPSIAGKVRDCVVFIGDRKCHFVSIQLLEQNIVDWIKKHENARTYSQIKQAHIEFEILHPFKDGNGRVGRLLMNWMLVRNRLNPELATVENRNEYYKWFPQGPTWDGSPD